MAEKYTTAQRVAGVKRRMAMLKGKTSKQIAKYLEAKSIEGYVGEDTNCPLAIFLNYESSVSESHVNITPVDGDEIVQIKHTAGMARFVDDFDGGLYPMLDARKKDEAVEEAEEGDA